MENLKELLLKVINGEQEKVPLPFTPIGDILDILEEEGFEQLELDGDETNGWQIDFWYKIQHLEKGLFQLSGSLYYGDMEFSKI